MSKFFKVVVVVAIIIALYVGYLHVKREVRLVNRIDRFQEIICGKPAINNNKCLLAIDQAALWCHNYLYTPDEVEADYCILSYLVDERVFSRKYLVEKIERYQKESERH